MNLGCFSMSLTVKDLDASQAFYEKLGFEVFAGDKNYHYLMMKNGECNIGLFQGMFEANLLTFNPGWDQQAGNLARYHDVRDICASLTEHGIEIEQKSLEGESGPGSFSVRDPDGNIILFDQHR